MKQPLLASDVSRLLISHGIKMTPAAVRWSANRGRIASTRTAGGVRIFAREDVELFVRQKAVRKSAGTSTA